MDAQLGIFFGLIAMLGWGLSDFLGAYISRKTTPLKAFTLTRTFGLLLLALFFLIFTTPVRFSPFSIILVLVTAVLYVLSGLSYYKGLTIGQVSVISPVASSYPALTVILSVLLLKESLTSQQIAAISLAILGSILASFKLKDLIKLNPKNAARGVNYAIFASLCWSFMLLFIGILSSDLGWYVTVLLLNAFSLLYLVSYSKVYKKDISFPAKGIILIIVLSAILDVFAVLSYSFGTTITYVAIIATVSSVYPAITILLARFFFKEKLDVNQWFGVLLVLVGLVLLSF